MMQIYRVDFDNEKDVDAKPKYYYEIDEARKAAKAPAACSIITQLEVMCKARATVK